MDGVAGCGAEFVVETVGGFSEMLVRAVCEVGDAGEKTVMVLDRASTIQAQNLFKDDACSHLLRDRVFEVRQPDHHS